MKKIALITGASSGIGLSAARALADAGFSLLLCARRTDRLLALQEELASKTETKILTFDVRDKEAAEQAFTSLPEEWKQVHLLLNNAGNAHGLAPIQDGDWEDWMAMIDINVKGLLIVSQLVIPYMMANKAGHIINIGSIAGQEVYPNGNVYCASKFAVDALSTGMRQDLFKHGIKVSQIKPGLVETEFSLVRFKGDEDRAASVYKGFTPLKPEDVADIIVFMATRPAHVNLADILVLPLDQAASTLVNRQV